MFSLLSCLSLASAVVAGAAPGDGAAHNFLKGRGEFGPISTNSAAGIAGGQVQCEAAPVSSFFAGLKPPVRSPPQISPCPIPQPASAFPIHQHIHSRLLTQPQFPTNSWWAPYAAPPGNSTAAGPFPYESSLDGSGVRFGISTNRQFDGTSVKQPTQVDWHAGFAEHNGDFGNHKATAFDTQVVTVRYFQNAASMDAYLVPGSPYMTFKFNGATPVFTSGNGGIKSFNGKDLNVGDSCKYTVSVYKGCY